MRMHRICAAVIAVAMSFSLSATNSVADKQKPINEKRIWGQRWSKADGSERRWAYSTGSCESGNNPRTDTGNGFLGAFQFIPSTWWDAPNTGSGRGNAHQLPQFEPWRVQAIVAIKLARRDGTGHWPVCG